MRNSVHGTPEQFEAALKHKIQELGGSIQDDVTSTVEIDDNKERYIHTLIGDIQSEFKSTVDSMKFDTTDDSLIITAVLGNIVKEFTVPYSDLKFDWDDIDVDTQYISNEIDEEFNREYVDDVISESSVNSASSQLTKVTGSADSNISDYDDEYDEISFDEWYRSEEGESDGMKFVDKLESLVKSNYNVDEFFEEPSTQGYQGGDFIWITLSDGNKYEFVFDWYDEQSAIYTDGPVAAAKSYFQKIQDGIDSGRNLMDEYIKTAVIEGDIMKRYIRSSLINLLDISRKEAFDKIDTLLKSVDYIQVSYYDPFARDTTATAFMRQDDGRWAWVTGKNGKIMNEGTPNENNSINLSEMYVRKQLRYAITNLDARYLSYE